MVVVETVEPAQTRAVPTPTAAGDERPTAIPVTPVPTAASPVVVGEPFIAQNVIPLRIGEHELQAELATTGEERARGLMFRESLPDDRGMLFVYPGEQHRSFWMRNTSIPLSIAFIDAEGTIVSIADMQPFDETGVPSAAPAQFALEVNQGWFAERGIMAGQAVTFELPPDIIIR